MKTTVRDAELTSKSSAINGGSGLPFQTLLLGWKCFVLKIKKKERICVQFNEQRDNFTFYAKYQALNAVFHHQMKHWEESWKYDAQRSIFDELQGVSSGDETLSNTWYYFSNKMVLGREIKDAKLSSFSSDFQTRNKH